MVVWVAATVILLAVCALAATLARRWFAVVTVAGVSMAPALRPGDRVLVRWHRETRVHVGDVLVFRDPDNQRAIKRVAALAGDPVPESVRSATGGAQVVPPGMLVLLGDGTRSGDSRQWGFIPADQPLGVVIRRLAARQIAAG